MFKYCLKLEWTQFKIKLITLSLGISQNYFIMIIAVKDESLSLFVQ